MASETKKLKVLIAAGGTGGHLFPGIAIATEIKRVRPDAQIVFAGTERGLESKVLPKLGWPLTLMKSHSIKDKSGISKMMAWGRLPLSILGAFGILRKEKPSLIVCIGGYAAGPISIAAWLSGISFVLVEPNAIAGFTNRILGRFARKAFVQFEEARRYFPNGKAFVSGNPVRSEVIAVRKNPEADKNIISIFVFGGSQGAVRINHAMVDALKFLDGYKTKISVIHQAGANDDIQMIERAYADAGVKAGVFTFIERIWECYSKADIVIARSGATTLSELMAISLPSILIPYPYAADDHQRANAESMVRIGGSVMILNKECTGEKLAANIKSFVDRPEKLNLMRIALDKVSNAHAAQKIVEESLKYV